MGDIVRTRGERTCAKRCFNTAIKTVEKAINDLSPCELVNSIFEELKAARKELSSKHTEYIVATIAEQGDGNAADVDDDTEDEYLVMTEATFRATEKAVFQYDQQVAEMHKQMSQEAAVIQQEAAQATAKAESKRTLQTLRNLRNMEFEYLVVEMNRVVSLKDRAFGLSSLETIESEMRSQFSRLNAANVKVVEQLDEEDAKVEVKLFVDMRAKYAASMDTIGSIKDELNAMKKMEQSMKPTADFQLQKIPLPSFNGNMRDYPKFKDDFLKYVQPRIGDNEAGVYVLTSCLKGDALDQVKNVDDDAEKVWKCLDEKYGDPCRLADEVMNEIKRASHIEEGDDCSLIYLVDIIERGYRDLKRLGVEGEISNSQTVSLIEEKLPRDVKLGWSKKVKKDGSVIVWANKFPKMLDFLLVQKRIREYVNADLRVSTQEASGALHHINGQSGATGSSFAKSPCLIHPTSTDKHSTATCNKYLTMDANGRIELLIKSKA